MKKSTLNEFRFITILVGIVAAFMIFLPSLIVKDTDSSYTGLEIAFGYEFLNLGGLGDGKFLFSFFNVLAYSLPLLAALLLFVSPKGYLGSAIIFGGAAVLLFLIPEFTVATVTVLGIVNEVSVEWVYGSGLIIAASLSVLGLLINLMSIFRKA